MSCQETQNLLHGYVDGELDLPGSLRIERHLQDCPACARAYQNQKALRLRLGDGSLYFKAPAKLRERVRRDVRAIVEEPRPFVLSWRWLAAGLSFALFAIIVVVLVLIQSGPAREDLLAQEVVSSHVRSLMANHLTDVASTDQHTVKPWFEGRLDFAPPVVDLSAQGFPLVGGRLDYIGDRPVAALVYQRRQHFINLFVWPSADAQGGSSKMVVRQGYNLIRWNSAGMTHWAVSDLNISELQQVAQALQSQP